MIKPAILENVPSDPEPSVALPYLRPLTVSLEKAGYDWPGIRKIISSSSCDAARITFSEYLAALEILVSAYGDETGNLSTRPLLPGTSAFVFASIRDCATLGEAMRKIAGAYNIAHGGYFNSVEVSDDYLIYAIDDAGFPFAPDQDPDYLFLVMESILQFLHLCFQNMMSLSSHAIDGHLRKVYSKRAHRIPEGDFLTGWNVPVRLGSLRYALIYNREAERLPIDVLNSLPDGAFDFYDRVAAYLDRARRPSDRDVTLCTRVRNEIAKGLRDQESVARSLGMSVPTLRRRLLNANTGFRVIKAEVLYSKARDQIARGQNPNTIAEALGFADLRSFNRAFKSWSGHTPVQHAKQTTRTLLKDTFTQGVIE